MIKINKLLILNKLSGFAEKSCKISHNISQKYKISYNIETTIFVKIII